MVTNDQINMKDISYEMVQQEAENQLQHDYDADYFEVAYGDTMSRMTKLAVDTVKPKRKRKLDMQLARVTDTTDPALADNTNTIAGTPNKHVLLALQINPSVNTTPNGPLLKGKSAKAELMHAEYKRALRRQAHRKK